MNDNNYTGNESEQAALNTNAEFEVQQPIAYDIQRAEAYLERLVREHDYIYVDTCSLLETPFELFLEHATPYLKAYRKQIIIPLCVVSELLNSNPVRFAELFTHLRDKIDTIVKMDEKIPEHVQTFGDNLFLAKFTELRTLFHQLLITEDVDLTKDIHGLRKSYSVKNIRRVNALHINEHGYLEKLPCFCREAQSPMPQAADEVPAVQVPLAPVAEEEAAVEQPAQDVPEGEVVIGVCKQCNAEFEITPQQLRATRPAYCPECREKRKIQAVCEKCGATFFLRKLPKDGHLICQNCR